MNLYPVLEWIHIVNATILFGAGIGSAWHLWATHKSENIPAIALAARNAVKMDRYITTPAVIIQPLTGALMIIFVGFQPLAPWLVASYALFILAGAFWGKVLKSQKRVQAMAEKAASGKKSLPQEYFGIMAAWRRFGLLALLSIFLIFYMMIMKPALWG